MHKLYSKPRASIGAFVFVPYVLGTSQQLFSRILPRSVAFATRADAERFAADYSDATIAFARFPLAYTGDFPKFIPLRGRHAAR